MLNGINGVDLHNLMLMASVKRLISLGYKPGPGDELLGDRIMRLTETRLESIRERCATEIVTLMGNNADKTSLETSARATFALAGIEIADQVHRDLSSLN